jgi:hypothetical protein
MLDVIYKTTLLFVIMTICMNYSSFMPFCFSSLAASISLYHASIYFNKQRIEKIK